MESINDAVSTLKGIGKVRSSKLEAKGIRTVEDLLGHYPKKYVDMRAPLPIAKCEVGNEVFIRGTVESVQAPTRFARGQSPIRVGLRDDSGSIEAIFFNSPYLLKTLKKGKEYYFQGKVSAWNMNLQLVQPIFIQSYRYKSYIKPIYARLAGLTSWEVEKLTRQGLDRPIAEILPDKIVEENNLCSRSFALENIHFPRDEKAYKVAKFRLIYEELFMLQLIIAQKGLERRKAKGYTMKADNNDFLKALPFELTADQKKTIKAIQRDMEAPEVMNRLIQGDVGCGKTVVAQAAIYTAVKSGFQAAFMAPTEILAQQHFDDFKKAFDPLGIEVALLTGSLKTAERKKILEGLLTGDIDIVIGTHALIQEGVDFKSLGLVVTDEQHRFGVNQRSLLSQKGEAPDVLLMTATPIPRSLAMTLYGEMDVSQIRTMPEGRQVILTRAVDSERARLKTYDFMKEEVERGRQAYVVTPLIDENEDLDLRSAVEVTKEVSRIMGSGIRVECLHGEMSSEEKDSIMMEFSKGEIDILVATVVIEVGINVPNATLMVVENASRFGLAQLHQLRGRVGRGDKQSFCVLLGGGASAVSRERMKTMTSTNDGFEIAEKDLELRGPGDLFGLRQHGLPDLKFANIIHHVDLMETIREQIDGLEPDDISPMLLDRLDRQLRL